MLSDTACQIIQATEKKVCTMFHLWYLTTTNSAINPQPLDHEPVYVDP